MGFLFWVQVAKIIIDLVREAEEIYDEAQKGESKKAFVLAILGGILDRLSNPSPLNEEQKKDALNWASKQINVTVEVMHRTDLTRHHSNAT